MWGLGQAGVSTYLKGTGEPWIVLIPGGEWQASRKTGALCPEQPLELQKASFINDPTDEGILGGIKPPEPSPAATRRLCLSYRTIAGNLRSQTVEHSSLNDLHCLISDPPPGMGLARTFPAQGYTQ